MEFEARGSAEDVLPHSVSVVIPGLSGRAAAARPPAGDRAAHSWRAHTCWPDGGRLRGAPRARQRAGRLGVGDASAGRGIPLRPHRLAEPQLRPARGHPGRHGLLRWRLDRHSRRGRTARPSRHPRDGRHRVGPAGGRGLRQADERPAARLPAKPRLPNGQDPAARPRPAATTPPTSRATDWFSARSAAVSRRMQVSGSTSTWRWAGWPALSPPARSSCGKRVNGRPATRCVHSSHTSGGWSCPAAPAPSGW